MAIDSTRPTLSTTLIPLKQESGATPLPVDRVLQALVVKSEGSTLTLALAGRVVEAHSTLQLIAGMKVAVRVEEENGKQLLRIVTPDDQATVKAEQALRQALPRQAPLGELFQRFANLATPQPAATNTANAPATASSAAASPLSSPPLPTAASAPTAPQTATSAQTTSGSTPATVTNTTTPLPQRLAEVLLRTLPSVAQLTTAEGVRQALLDSGLFMEQKLANGTDPGLRNDLKANLLRLVQQLATASTGKAASAPATPHPSAAMAQESAEGAALLQLLKEGESALARIQLHQLTTLQKSEGAEPHWLFEIPLRTAQQQHEVLELRIQREQRGSGEQSEPCWTVTLQMMDAQQQPLRAVVTLLGGAISTTFWAAQTETAAQFRDHLDELQARLTTQGLEVGRLGSFVGHPVMGEQIEKRSSGFLSEKA